MNRRRFRSVRWGWHAVTVAAGLVLSGAAAGGQTIENLPVARTFGAGVHAYFSGAYDRSYDDMTAVIEAGSEDPRARYFRGLAALRMGRLDEAEADFSSGAALEARALGNWRVSSSLERVQGAERLQLERHRVRARVALLQQDRAAARKRYSDIEAAQPGVLRSRRPAAERPGDAANPFAEDAAPTPRSETTRPAPEPEPMPEPAAPAPPGDALEPEPEPAPVAPAEPEMPAAPAAPAGPVEPEAPAEPAGPATPAEAPATGGEDPFGDSTSPAPPAAPQAEEAEAPAGQ